MIAIRVLAWANGERHPCAGFYVKNFEHEACGGLGAATLTPDPDEARVFKNDLAAIQFYEHIPLCMPVCFTGGPNRPMTAMRIELEDLAAGS